MTCAVGRAVMSATPPGGKGTIIWIGLDGKASCAPASSGEAAIVPSAAALARRVRRFTGLFLLRRRRTALRSTRAGTGIRGGEAEDGHQCVGRHDLIEVVQPRGLRGFQAQG